MGAFRKAGVWLGLVEEEDDPRGEAYDDDYADEDDDYAPPARPRSLTRQRSERDLRIRDDREARGDRRRLGERVGVAEHPRADRADRAADRADHARAEHTRLDRGENARADRGDTRVERDARVDRDTRVERDTRSDRYDHGRDAEPGLRVEPGRTATDRADQRSDYARSEHARADQGRTEYGRSDRASVRQLSRPGASSYPTQDNLALAPQPPQSQSQTHARDRAAGDDANCRITTLHPTSYSEARTIGEHFRDGFPVIMNLTEMDEPDAKRLVDFAAGLAFGLRGSMERVTNRVFLLSPPNIQVSAEDKARIAEGRFFQQP